MMHVMSRLCVLASLFFVSGTETTAMVVFVLVSSFVFVHIPFYRKDQRDPGILLPILLLKYCFYY